MSSPEAGAPDQGLEEVTRLAEEEEGGFRHLSGWSRYLVPGIAICWCFFQLSIASWWILDAVFIRSIHLGFAMLIVFLNIPTLKRRRTGLLACLSVRDRIPLSDYGLALIACLSALYIAIDYLGLSGRMGAPLTRDIVIGAALVLLLLEATRRAIGPALSVIALLFTLYSFFGPYMPDLIAFKGVSLGRYMGQVTMSTEGIYGIPLDVSATIVFLFVLFGSMLERAGAGHYFIQLAICLLGRFKGGPAKAAVLGSGLTGLVSGSSIANIVTTGTFTIPLMKSVGYPARKAAAIEVAASTDGQLAPPIMGAAAFIIAEYVNVPYVAVVKAAAIPAFVSYAALLYITHMEASKLGLRGLTREEVPRFVPTFFGGLHYLIPLGVLIYELLVLRHSPELSAFRAIMVIAVVMLVQEPVRAMLQGESIAAGFTRSLLQIVDGLIAGGRNMVGVAIATAAAGIIVGVVTMGLGGLITDIIDVLSGGNIFLMLIITAVACLILGMGLPTTATYIVMASLTAPAIVTIGEFQGFVVPLIAAHLFCFYFGILADDTPPVGLAAYAAAAIAKSDPIPTGLQGFMYDIRTAILPFMFIFNTDLLLIGVDSWPVGLFIFAMSCIGAFAFASATQGWFTARNKWYEIPFFLAVTVIMLRPDSLAELTGVGHGHRYWMYPVGLALFAALYAWQRLRVPANA
jgi:TRAP transporter 4TM/12TM fusion protein